MRHPKFRGLGFRVQGVGICTFAASSPTMPGARQKHRSLTIFSQHSAKHAHSQINHCSIFRTIARRRLPCRSWSTSRSVLVVEFAAKLELVSEEDMHGPNLRIQFPCYVHASLDRVPRPFLIQSVGDDDLRIIAHGLDQLQQHDQHLARADSPMTFLCSSSFS